jgi:alanine dehydrogenase
MKTLIVTRKVVESVLDVETALPVIEEAFLLYGLGRTVMPPKTYVPIPRHRGDFRAMPAYLDSEFEAAGVKWVNVHPDNLGGPLPSIMAVLVYSDTATGFPLAVMDATHITCIRTGAAGGVAAKYLARADSRTVGVVGCGVQATAQLAAARAVRPIERVRAYDARREAAERFCARATAKGLTAEVADTVEACVREAEILVTTTPVREPVVRADWLRPGVHINAIGADAPGKEELEPEALLRARIVVDDWEQASHSGEINVPLARGLITRDNVRATLGEIVAGLKPARENDDEITLFDSTGLAIQDIAAARYVYNECRRQGLGTEIDLVI